MKIVLSAIAISMMLATSFSKNQEKAGEMMLKKQVS